MNGNKVKFPLLKMIMPLGEESRLFSRNTLLPPASVGPSSPLLKRKKKRDMMEVMEEEAQELLSYFNHCNVDALLRLTRNTLEMLRKRIQNASPKHFLGGCCHVKYYHTVQNKKPHTLSAMFSPTPKITLSHFYPGMSMWPQFLALSGIR